MNLWKIFGTKPEVKQEIPQPEIRRIDPATLYRTLIMTGEEIEEHLTYSNKELKNMISQDQTLQKEEAEQLYNQNIKIARLFEIRHEILRYQKEKLESLENFEQKTKKDFQEILKQLEEEPQTQTTKK